MSVNNLQVKIHTKENMCEMVCESNFRYGFK